MSNEAADPRPAADIEAPNEMFDEAERVLKPYIEMIPPQCDSHGRVDVIDTTDGDEVCEICHGDGFSGELSTIHSDTVAIEVVAALWKMVQASLGVLRQDAEHNATRAEKAEARVRELEAFKAYVHKRLDAMSVPAVIEDAHLANGCRIGGRLDYVESLIGRLFAQVAWAKTKEPIEQKAASGGNGHAKEPASDSHDAGGVQKGLGEATVERVARAIYDASTAYIRAADNPVLRPNWDANTDKEWTRSQARAAIAAMAATDGAGGDGTIAGPDHQAFSGGPADTIRPHIQTRKREGEE